MLRPGLCSWTNIRASSVSASAVYGTRYSAGCRVLVLQPLPLQSLFPDGILGMCLHMLLRSSVSPIPVDGASCRDRHTSLTPLEKDPVSATAPGLCVSISFPRSCIASKLTRLWAALRLPCGAGLVAEPDTDAFTIAPCETRCAPHAGSLVVRLAEQGRPQSRGCKTRARGGNASVRMRTRVEEG